MLCVVVVEAGTGELAVDFNSCFGEFRASFHFSSDPFLSTKLHKASISESLQTREQKIQSYCGKEFGSSSKSETYDPAIPLLGIYPRELKTGTPIKTWTRRFIHYSQQTKVEDSPNVHRPKNGPTEGGVSLQETP